MDATMKAFDADKTVEVKIPVQLNVQVCQHVESNACIKCRFPFTWRRYIAE